MYVASMPSEFLMKREEFRESLKGLLTIFRIFLEVMPKTCEYLLPNLLVVEHIITGQGPLFEGFKCAVVDEEIITLLEDLKENREQAEGKVLQQKTLERGGAEVDHILPPENFREIPIFPITDDVHTNDKPFLRANKQKGKYNDLEHYLDVQFRLLREDFMGPLRAGIREYLEQKQHGQAGRKRFENIKVYFDVQLLCPVCTPRGITYRMKFNVERLKHIRWQSSKRLLYGGLVCLSSDDFNTMLFATVCNRQAKDLENGVFEVIFNDNTRIPSTSDRFVMAESSAYFEAYRHVLQGVKDITAENFPFQKYIVECNTEKASPRYVNNTTKIYDLSFLAESVADEHETIDPIDLRTLRNVPILEHHNWPSETLLKLDESQAKALKNALSLEFCIIQGPPGTGKTYVGLKIVQALLKNKQGWCHTAEDKRPILIVCYTNHALDQFLEGIISFHEDGIVRVGGRSQSEEIKKRSIGALKAEQRSQRRVPRRIFRESHDVRSEMGHVRGEIEKISVRLEATSRGLVNDLLLDKYISDDHYDSLYAGYNKLNPYAQQGKHASAITEWLGLGVHSEIKKVRGADKHVEGSVDGAAAHDEDEEIDVEEDAEMITAARHLDEEEEEKMTEDEKKRLQNLERLKSEAEREDLSLTVDALNFLEQEPKQRNNEGWQLQNKEKRRRKQRLKQGLSGTDAMAEEDARKIKDVWEVKIGERWRLYRYWLNQYREMLRQVIKGKEEEYQQLANRYVEIGQELDLEIMEEATIVGMTTTGAARYKTLLQRVAPRIVIVEEAAEVLEAHLVTSISSGCEHFILIGDHKQLRPSPSVYELAKKYHLDISLFERMINNGMGVVTLAQQHRMRPLISTLMEPIYPGLLDDESVYGRDNVKGVAKDMFFIDHTEPESVDDELKSKSNIHEAKYVAALCRYLILQGYDPSQITVLTMYSGQLMQLKHNMPRNIYKGIRVTTVDNFQGEENDIVILSLVRSNDQGHIGFVASDNRICVALSRAKLGLYVLGNFAIFTMKNELWEQIIKRVEQQSCKGNALPLFCQNHPDFKLEASKPEDFDKAPEGGCMRPCEVRLDCGHACPRTCHSYDRDHKQLKCKKPCNNILCDYGHMCEKKCHQECGPCQVPVPKTVPGCKHVQDMPCHKDPSTVLCLEECKHILSCGHQCTSTCGSPHATKCYTPVEFTWPCGHSGTIKCYRTRSPPPCPEPCSSFLKCEHPCTGKCGGCLQGRLHEGCHNPCERTLVCGHACKESCTKSCPPCENRCENRCIHSKCPKRCGEPCARCKEPCQWQCEHYYCTMLCSEPCNRPPCNEPCPKLIDKCLHPCIGLCGEPCPKLCGICDREQVTEIFFGTEEDEDARFVELEDCGHVLEVTGLDHWMEMKNDKDTDAVQDQSIKLKVCPKCKTPIRRNLRYGTIVNEVLNDIEFIKGKIFGTPAQINLKKEELLDLVETKLRTHDSSNSDLLRGRLSRKFITQEELALIENQIEYLRHIGRIKRDLSKEMKSFSKEGMQDEASKLDKELDVLKMWLIKHDTRISDQVSAAAFQTKIMLQFARKMFGKSNYY